KSAGLPEDAVCVVGTTDRKAVGELLKLKEYIDVIIPRGGKSRWILYHVLRAFRLFITTRAYATLM
ncbi:MAG: hypothetical protein ABSA34_00005, partial [Candidatus Goldiibacteriota bacterium]